MTVVKSLSLYEKQQLSEKRKKVSSSCCRICHKLIGSKSYLTFEERFFHTNCLKLKDNTK